MPEKQHWVVAFSGGKDSSALAHLCASLHQQGKLPQLTLMHIHHGLQACADEWITHTQQQAAKWQVPFVYQKVDVNPVSRHSTEALARDARYKALRSYCRQHKGVLLMAHHLDDVLETVLLQLKRGAGPKGLAGMAEIAEHEGIIHARPLVGIEQKILIDYLHTNNIDYIEDPSNSDQTFDRNFVRHSVVPLLTERWPAIRHTVARSARLCAQQDSMIQAQVEHWLQTHLTPLGCIPMEPLSQQPLSWQKEIVRHWCQSISNQLPSEAQLETFFNALSAADDKQPELRFAKVALRKYKAHLYLISNYATDRKDVSDCQTVDKDIAIKSLKLTLQRRARAADDSPLFTLPLEADSQVTVKAVPKNARITLLNQTQPRSLSRYLKDWGIPPWTRDDCYLLCKDGEAMALLAYGQCEPLKRVDHSKCDQPTIAWISVSLLTD
ncbi:tRNA lysidine(34) synthetase TilS [Alteromonas sediminis]|uniref:tRNA lysidine(34) synthetase TilS n=1 Tax=Alteromonas sediminis TaxID=2259342 RepID=UPI00140552FB|nr:tRNA lysidine(34) synthetase TilS [Alteromonas sediminis]